MKAAYYEIFGEVSAPDYKEFIEIRYDLDNIDQNNYSTLTITAQWQRISKMIIEFSQNLLSRERELRNDYKECVDLVLLILRSPFLSMFGQKP